MRTGYGVIVGLALMALAGVAAARGEDRPDFSTPEVLQKILGEAKLRDTLEVRGPKGEELFYAPDSKAPYTGWAKTRHLNGKVRGLYHFKDGKQEGWSSIWHDNGQKAAEATYRNGKQEGLSTVWHDNGQKAEECTYKDGKQEGLDTRWHDNGRKKQEGTYKGGVLEGLATQWHDNGKKAAEVTYAGGRMEGSYTIWHDDGEKAEEGAYKDGKLEGLVTKWHDNGEKAGEITYRGGKPIFENEPDLDDPKTLEGIVGKAVMWDTLITVGPLYHLPGNPDPYTGWIKKLHDNGKVAALGMLKDGKPDGLWTLWDDDGRKEEESRYIDGVKLVE